MAASDTVRVYLDACCYIDLVQQQNGHPIEEGRDNHIWYCRKFLDAARAKDIEVYGSTILVAECTAIRDEKRQRILTDQVKSSFRALLLAGNPVIPVQPTPKILERARDLAWVDGLNISSVDAIHIATALELKCNAFITSDGPMCSKVAPHKSKLSIGIGAADSFKAWLPDKYKQEPLSLKEKK